MNSPHATTAGAGQAARRRPPQRAPRLSLRLLCPVLGGARHRAAWTAWTGFWKTSWSSRPCLGWSGCISTRPLSNASYVLLTIFFCLHTIGAHYTYSEVPAGYWIRDLLGLGRNHYDRLVHFSFGLLMCYPLQELIASAPRGRAATGRSSSRSRSSARAASPTRSWNGSSRSWSARHRPWRFSAPRATSSNSQKDSGLAALGAIITAIAVTAIRKKRGAAGGTG